MTFSNSPPPGGKTGEPGAGRGDEGSNTQSRVIGVPVSRAGKILMTIDKEQSAKFCDGDKVRHIRSGKVYTIGMTPLSRSLRYEPTGESCYTYTDWVNTWVRPQSQMEDGRFELVERGGEGEPASGVDLIAAERQRQIEQEGWTPEHDAMHDGGELTIAAACYAVEGTCARVIVETGALGGGPVEQHDGWPWRGWDKRKKHDRLRRLVIAGALIAAEIDREQRTDPDVTACPALHQPDRPKRKKG